MVGGDAGGPARLDLIGRVYTYSQHGDRMYGGSDKMLRFVQYSIASLGALLVGGGCSRRTQFWGRQLLALKHEIDRGRIVSRFFGCVDEAVFLREPQGVYLGKQDWLLKAHGYLMHLSLIAYYVLETGW